MTLNKWMGRSQLLPEMFEIVLRPILWVAGSEQPSPPLHPPKVGGLLSLTLCSLHGMKVKVAKWCCKDCKMLSSPPTFGGWGGLGGEGCSLPATHKIGRSTISNISGNSWDLFITVLMFFLTICDAKLPVICSSVLGQTRLQALYNL